MPGQRVYEVARQFDLSSEAMVKLLHEMGISVKSHMSSIDDAAVQRIREKFATEKEAQKERDELKKKRFAPPRPEARRPAEGERPGAPALRKQRGPMVVTTLPRIGDRGPRSKRRKRRGLDQKAVEENIRRTLALMEHGALRRHRRRHEGTPGETEAAEPQKVVKVSEYLTAAELADLLGVPANRIVSVCLELGLMVTVNQRLDFDTISLICDEFGYAAEREEEYRFEALQGETDRAEDLVPRPPIVTVMGHVDHGKTTLLDHIRKTNVIAGEKGGITQHIGAYEVDLPQGKVTFLDTPGHEAFTAMRARGVQVTDVVVLVVAADDQVMPQTVEAIDHAKAAGVPIVVAINKIDLPNGVPLKVKQDLMRHTIVVEEFGGKTLCAEISAKKGTGIEHLLELLLLQAELLELRANPDRPATGAVVEARLDRGMGPVATVLVTNGALRVGDSFVCGLFSGRVRALLNERGDPVEQAGPASPVQVLGFDGVPQAGDTFTVLADEREARDISHVRQRLRREQDLRRPRRVTLDKIYDHIKAGEVKSLRLILKADVDGSVEALADALGALATSEVGVDVIHRGVGAITENDILLAAASDAIIVGFQVGFDAGARTAMAREGVDVRLYDIIYEAVSDVKKAMEGLLAPTEREIPMGQAEVREIFHIPRVGSIAGCFISEGTIARSSHIRVVREKAVVHEGAISSLKRFKDDVREVAEGLECGIGLQGWDGIQVGDIIEAYQIEEVRRSLD